MNRRFCLLGSFPGTVVTLRGDLTREIMQRGYEATVLTAAPEANIEADIKALDVDFQAYHVERNAMSVRSDLRTLLELRRYFVDSRPDIALAYTVKPIIWGGIASRHVRHTRFFAMITGIGYAFQGGGLKRRLLSMLVTRLYRYALRRAEGVIFQNPENRDLFIRKKIVDPQKCHVVNGSGVNTKHFKEHSFVDEEPRFLLIARLLGEKGIREYIAAAEIVKQVYPRTQFDLVGPEDPSTDGIPFSEVESWHKSGVIKYRGPTSDPRPFLRECHIYVLPSYHEGVPRTVLEAMCTGRPILTTDVVGCRETVIDGQNGWLVPKADAQALAERMLWFIEHREQWQAMGEASRKLAEERFDVVKVNEQMLKIMGIT
ncbi:glycosyltransferase family 4 protein [Roseimaritima sediminicola]|uniref:glycosyltransferase family 4 protein n=1 Tax=Roseimaritima sediminicola TaxID=2662066 RepID=UPI0012983B55|nr:glycosyltransferase family 4 protein [Roseimaritima sediminicola]